MTEEQKIIDNNISESPIPLVSMNEALMNNLNDFVTLVSMGLNQELQDIETKIESLKNAIIQQHKQK